MILLVVSGFLEMHVLSEKAKHIQMTIRTAGDMALQQSQVIDEYLTYGGRDSYKLLMPSDDGNGFVETNLFGGVFNLTSEIETNNEAIFDRMYMNNDFWMLSERSNALRSPVKYWNSEDPANRTGFSWYYITKMSMIGTDKLPPNAKKVKTASGGYVSDSFAEEIFTAYRLKSHIKTTGGEDYYNTPLNFGVTYLNEDLLRVLFMNNMDLLMRIKYRDNLNTPEGGNGILKGTTYADKVTDELDKHNPINDGLFTLLRGNKVASTPDVQSFEGVKPLITYKVIDMYDTANDDLLVHLFGAKKGGFSSKAEYLKELDRDKLNPVTNQPYTTKPIVVAKVTFYVDVVVPYFNVIIRELRSFAGLSTNNFVDMSPDNPGGVDGTRRIEYTRYFAVTP